MKLEPVAPNTMFTSFVNQMAAAQRQQPQPTPASTVSSSLSGLMPTSSSSRSSAASNCFQHGTSNMNNINMNGYHKFCPNPTIQQVTNSLGPALLTMQRYSHLLHQQSAPTLNESHLHNTQPTQFINCSNGTNSVQQGHCSHQSTHNSNQLNNNNNQHQNINTSASSCSYFGKTSESSQQTASWRNSRLQASEQAKKIAQPRTGPIQTLLDLSAKIVAENIPFQAIEQEYEHIPEPVQRRIIFWSFPQNEDDIRMYSSLSTDQPQQSSSTSSSLNLTQQYQPLQNSINPSEPAANNSTNNNFQVNPVAAAASLLSAATSSTSVSSLKSQQNKQLAYNKGKNLCNEGLVQDVLQVGFSLSGIVNIDHTHLGNVASSKVTSLQNQSQTSGDSNQSPFDSSTSHVKSYRVSVTFDRCKITSVSCSCDFQDIFWCEHVVALILYRIRNSKTIDLRIPISETLSTLNRQQLQKLVQYLIAEHHTEVLPTAQRLLDEITLSSTSAINQYCGAPDPTAGNSEEVLLWHLDEQQVYEKTKKNLDSISSGSNKEASKHIFALFDKIKEMFCARDSNGTRLLKLITEQFLQFGTRNDKCRPLWDQLISLWVIVIANPDMAKRERQNFIDILVDWSKVARCPKEDIERRISLKRKMSDLPETSDYDDYLNSNKFYVGNVVQNRNLCNNYPAHLPSNRDLSFNPAFPVLRPSNQMLPSWHQCPHSSIQMNKRIKCQNDNENIRNRPSGSSLNCSRSLNNSLSRQNENHLNHLANMAQEPRSVFYLAIDLKDMSWDDEHLKLILNNDGPIEFTRRYPLWNEPLSLVAARVMALKSYGYKEQALRLTVAAVRKLKVVQDQLCAYRSQSGYFNTNDTYENESWIGHPFDPTNVLFNTLLEASTAPTVNSNPLVNNTCRYNSCSACNPLLPQMNSESVNNSLFSEFAPFTFNHQNNKLEYNPLNTYPPRSRRNTGSSSNHGNIDKATYYHVPVPGCCQKDSYLSMAIELAIMSLSQQRPIQTNQTAHERAIRQESDLISKLEGIDTSIDSALVDILKSQVAILLEGGQFQSSSFSQSSESAPLHTFARYLFESLVSHSASLAYKIGIYALKIPLTNDENTNENYPARSRSFNYTHLQAEQLSLAQALLSKAKEETQTTCLRKIYRASVKNIRNASNLMKLARHALREARPHNQIVYPNLTKTSLDLGLQVLKATVSPHNVNVKTRREAILFIVDCVTELDLNVVYELMKSWKEYLTPVEALNMIVGNQPESNLRSQAMSKYRLKDDFANIFNQRARDLCLECALRDPINCSLEAIKYCETDNASFNKALQIVVESGRNGSMDSSQLMKVADHVCEQGSKQKAFDIALVAVDSLRILPNVENSSAKKDIFRACDLAREIQGFTKLIPRIINNVQCASVLSEIYQTYKPAHLVNPNIRRRDAFVPNGKFYLPNYDDEIHWWDLLLRNAIESFETTTQSRLNNISPRHYSEFIDFLVKAQATYSNSIDGPQKFKVLIHDIMKSYRTKKKLIERLKERFESKLTI